MKKNDWAAIILIIGLVALVSYFLVGALLPSPADDPETVPIAVEITDVVAEPSTEIFSSNAINPTVRTTIGDQGGQQPFDIEE